MAVSRIYSEKPVSKEVEQALVEFGNDLAEVILKAQQAGLMQGFIVSTLCATLQIQTQAMIDMRPKS